MDVVTKELLGQLIAQSLVNVITVHTDVAQDNCHAITVSRRNADVTARRPRPVGESCRLQRRLRIGARSLMAHRVTPRSSWTWHDNTARCHDLLGRCHRFRKMQINPVCEQHFKLNMEHDINMHGVKQFASEVCNVFPDANSTRDVSDKPVSNVVPICLCTVWDV